MRTEKEMFSLILNFANTHPSVHAVLLNGSRANPTISTDIYQDYDIVYIVNSLAPFVEDTRWIDYFGERLCLQMPETMRDPCANGNFNWMMLFTDGNRLDLTLAPVENLSLFQNDSLTIPLLDKNSVLPAFPQNSDKSYWISAPPPLYFSSCCNNFWWCLQNVAKGIARNEIAYAMMMYHTVVREELHTMIDYYIGGTHAFSVSAGKMGKHYQKFLSESLYSLYCQTYSNTDTENFWNSIFAMCSLFHTVAVEVANFMGYSYSQQEEDGIREYLSRIRSQSSPSH